MEIEITGSIGLETVDELRVDLGGTGVAMEYGPAGERLVRILGDLTPRQVEVVRTCLQKLFEAEQISGIVLKRGSIEMSSASREDRAALEELIQGLREHVSPARST